MQIRTVAPFWLALLSLAAVGCGGLAQQARELDPLARYDVQVARAAALGPYLQVRLVGDGLDQAFLAPDTPACRGVLEEGARARYARDGHFGRVDGEGARCDLAGVVALDAWRDRFPRARRVGLPRATARFRVIHRDEMHTLVRGRFPLASRVQIPSGFDLVALLPSAPGCQRPVENGEAEIEFSDSGDVAYRLLGDAASCPILGFATPLPDRGGRG